MEDIKLYGPWPGSPSATKKVEIALKLKGIPYEFIQEDLTNKSDALLHYNPVHKMVPVLVHNGRPICESHVIIEYIDEQWKNAPKLLPDDPYERAKIRFWADFYAQKFSARKLILAEGEEKRKLVRETNENQMILEEGIKRDFSGKSPFFHGENPGFLDVIIAASVSSYRAVEEVIGEKLIDPQIYPLFFSWMTAIEKHPVVKETIPDHQSVVDYILRYKQRIQQSLNKV